MMGAERRSIVMSESEKKLTAYHEAGHVIVGRLVPEHDPVHKVSIIPRGRALGVTMFLPERDRYSMSKRQLESQISSLFGGRVAEEMTFGPEQVTTGASNDIERATDIARNMVTRFGLSDTMGPLAYAEDEGEVFLGRSVTQQRQVSPETALSIDRRCGTSSTATISVPSNCWRKTSTSCTPWPTALLTYETIDKDQIDDIMAGRPMREPTSMAVGARRPRPMAVAERPRARALPVSRRSPSAGSERPAPHRAALGSPKHESPASAGLFSSLFQSNGRTVSDG
jgi:cell division protease FtsH